MGNQGPSSEAFLHVEVEDAGAISDTGEKSREWGVLEVNSYSAFLLPVLTLCSEATLPIPTPGP